MDASSLDVAGTFRTAAVTRSRKVVKLAGRGHCRERVGGLRFSGYAASTFWAWALALLVVAVVLGVTLLFDRALESLAPSLVLLGILPLLRLDGSPTRRPEIVDARWDRISDVSLVTVGRRRMLRFTIDGMGSIDFRPDGDLVAAYQEFQGCIAAHRLHLPR
jgi:hypothetical protein